MRLLSIASLAVKGGASISLLNTLKGLKSKGVEIVVVTPSKGYLTDELSTLGIKYIILPVPYWAYPRIGSKKDYWKFLPKLGLTLLHEFKSFLKLRSFSKKWKPDVIHTNVSVIDIGYRVAKSLNIPHIWHIREYGDKDFNIYSLDGPNNLRKKLNDSNSIAITAALKEYFNLGSRCKVVYNGIETRGELSVIKKKEDRIIYVGRLSTKKGVDEILDAFISIYKEIPNLKLDFIGSYDKKYGESIMRRISASNLEDRIRLIGPVKDPYPIMQGSKAIIVASESEGFGRITAEAMLNNCLVIGKDLAGTKEQFDNGKAVTGKEIGLRYLSRKDLCDAILQLNEMDSSTYHEIILNAQSIVKNLYSTEKNVDKTFEALSNLISGV